MFLGPGPKTQGLISLFSLLIPISNRPHHIVGLFFRFRFNIPNSLSFLQLLSFITNSGLNSSAPFNIKELKSFD